MPWMSPGQQNLENYKPSHYIYFVYDHTIVQWLREETLETDLGLNPDLAAY